MKKWVGFKRNYSMLMSFVTLNYMYFNLNRNIEMVSLIGKQK